MDQVNCTDSVLPELKQMLGDKKILHFGSLAGWPHTLASVSRKLGINAENVVHAYKDVYDLDRQLSYDRALFKTTDRFPVKVRNTLKFLLNIPEEYGVVHYHSSNLLHREAHFLFEGPYLKRRSVPMVLSLGGGDARFISEAQRKNPYFFKKKDAFSDRRISLRWRSWSQHISLCVTDPELMQIAKRYFDDVAYFPQPVDLDRFEYSPPRREKCPVLLHVPTEPLVKGTEHIVAAVERLKKKGLEFEFKLMRQLTQKEFYRQLADCDAYIDDLNVGAYGVTAVEAMAMGKPVVTFIREDLVGEYPAGMPLANANPSNIEATIERLVLDSTMRARVGSESRAYAVKYHDADQIVKDLAVHYARLLRSNR